jgi:hypothetical protein
LRLRLRLLFLRLLLLRLLVVVPTLFFLFGSGDSVPLVVHAVVLTVIKKQRFCVQGVQ